MKPKMGSHLWYLPTYQDYLQHMKIKITKVSYGRTINMGNYESVRLDLTADVAAHEDYKEVLEELKGEMLKLEKRTKKEGF